MNYLHRPTAALAARGRRVENKTALWRARGDGLSVDLLGCLDDDHPREGREPARAEPLPEPRRAQHHPALDRRHEERGRGRHRREQLVAQ